MSAASRRVTAPARAPATCTAGRLAALGADTAACALPQVVYGHLDDPESADIQRGVTYLNLRPGERGGVGSRLAM